MIVAGPVVAFMETSSHDNRRREYIAGDIRDGVFARRSVTLPEFDFCLMLSVGNDDGLWRMAKRVGIRPGGILRP
jgi:hypothetical protein